jgi:LPXTG-motif cell wall-anchored protein
MNPTHPRVQDASSRESVRRLLNAELSLASRLGHVGLGLSAAMMTAVVASLWMTEPSLPLRTQIGFGVMVGIGLSWVGFAVWVLTHRRPLLAGHRIVAGRMAVAFTSLFLLGAVVAGMATGGSAAYAAAALGLAMLAAAVVVLRRAHVTTARLRERRVALERELGKSTA